MNAFCCGMFLGGLFTAFMIMASTKPPRVELQIEAIQRGYALHCPQTGDFAWKGECDD